MIKALPFLLSAALAYFLPLKGEDAGDSSHYDALKPLEWLVGDWSDQDPSHEFDISYLTKWDGNKHFINQYFNVAKSGKNDIWGDQIIAWDPAQKKIRSWIFDSDGGFGTAVWNKGDDNVWYATVQFTAPDGSKMTATHVYTKIDSSAYSFASVSRDANGVILPDLGPYKIIRKK